MAPVTLDERRCAAKQDGAANAGYEAAVSQVKKASVSGRETSGAEPGTGSPGRFSNLH